MAIQRPIALIASLVTLCGIFAPQATADQATRQTAASEYRVTIVTDDDFLIPDQNAWCHAELTQAIARIKPQRPETTIELIAHFAGEPEFLSATKVKIGPRRAICFVCDTDDRVLSFCVGIPSDRQLKTLIEDADQANLLRIVGSMQTKTAIDPEVQQQDDLAMAIHQRSSRRVLKIYRPLLSTIDRQTSIAVAVTRLMPALNADRVDRFQVVESTDRLKWISLQQHAETMRHWCDAILPALIGKDVQTVWPEIASVVWDAQPWTIPPSESDLIPWYSQTIDSGPIVLSVASDTVMLGQLAASNAVDQRKSADIDVKALTANVSHRQISIASLALLMQHRKDRPAKLLSGAGSGPTGLGAIWAIIENQRSPIELVYGRSIDRLPQLVRKLSRDQ